MAKIVKYSCGKDDCILHETLEEARECALAGVSEEVAYECGICGCYHDEEVDSVACCSEEKWVGRLDRAKERLERAKNANSSDDILGNIFANIIRIENKLKEIREKQVSTESRTEFETV